MDVKFSPQNPMMADYLRHLFPPDAAGNLKVKSTNAITSFFRSQDVADLHECIAYLYRPASRRITPARADTFTPSTSPASSATPPPPSTRPSAASPSSPPPLPQRPPSLAAG